MISPKDSRKRLPDPHRGDGSRRDITSGATIGKLPEEVFQQFGGKAGPAERLSPPPPGTVNLAGKDRPPTSDTSSGSATKLPKENGVKKEEKEKKSERDELETRDSEGAMGAKKQERQEKQVKQESKEKKKAPNFGLKKEELEVKEVSMKKERKKKSDARKKPNQEEKKDQKKKKPERVVLGTAIGPEYGGKCEGASRRGGQVILGLTGTLLSGGTTQGVSYACVAERGTGRSGLSERLEPPFVPRGTLLASARGAILSRQNGSWVQKTPKESSQLHVVQCGELYHVSLVAERVRKQFPLFAGVAVEQVTPLLLALSKGPATIGLVFDNGEDRAFFEDTIGGIDLNVAHSIGAGRFKIPTRNQFSGLRVEPLPKFQEEEDEVRRVVEKKVDPKRAEAAMKKEKKSRTRMAVPEDLVKMLNLPTTPMSPRKLESVGVAKDRAESTKKIVEEPDRRTSVKKEDVKKNVTTPSQKKKKKYSEEGSSNSPIGTPEPDQLSVGKSTEAKFLKPRSMKTDTGNGSSQNGAMKRRGGAEKVELAHFTHVDKEAGGTEEPQQAEQFGSGKETLKMLLLWEEWEKSYSKKRATRSVWHMETC